MSWTDPSVLRRFLRLWALGLSLLFAAWLSGYFLVPQGALKDVFLSSRLPLESARATSVVGRIALYNGLIASGLIAIANLFRVGRFPLGYLPVLIHWALFGLFLGTDSFAYSQGGRLLPSVSILLGGSGVFEITGYTLIAAATCGFNLFRQTSWTDWSTVRERSWQELRLTRSDWIALAVAFALILFAALREGLAIITKIS